jgi:hypothetical protein
MVILIFIVNKLTFYEQFYTVFLFAGHKFYTLYQTKSENGGSPVWGRFSSVTAGMFRHDECYGTDAQWFPFSSSFHRFAQHVSQILVTRTGKTGA